VNTNVAARGHVWEVRMFCRKVTYTAGNANGWRRKGLRWLSFYEDTIIFVIKAPVNQLSGRSQWPRSLRHEVYSLARTLGSWVRIPLEAWMPVFILCLCKVAALRRADYSPVLPNVFD
jgi:hypothetical protein